MKIFLLYSGGRDSTLLLKLLSLSKNKITLSYFNSHPDNPYFSETVLDNASRLGVDGLITIETISDPLEIMENLGPRPFGGTNLLGLNEIDKYVNLENYDFVIHAQGADILSGVVHNQSKSFYNFNSWMTTFRHLNKMIRYKNRPFLSPYLAKV